MKKILILVLLIFIVAVCFSCAGKDDGDYAKNLYTIDMTIDEKIICKQNFNFINDIKDGLTELKFNLYANAYRKEAQNKAYIKDLLSYGGIDITFVEVDGKKVNFTLSEDKNILTVPIPELKLEECVDITMDYYITVPECNLRLGKYNKTLNLGNFYPVLSVYENDCWREDVFTYVGDPFYTEIANYNVTIRSDTSLVVASTGDIIKQEVADGKKVLTVKAENVRDFAVVASKSFKKISRVVGDTTVFYYYIKDLSPADSLETAANAIKLFGKTFGEYPYGTYSVVETAFAFGGMEYPMLVYVSDAEKDRESVIVHETAHQWWYGLVGNDSINESFLDEGLTTFSTAYYNLLNGDNEKFEAEETSMKKSCQNYLNIKKAGEPGYISKLDLSLREYTTREYNVLCYDEANLMFKNVYDMAGRKKFEKSLQLYFDNCKYRIATRNDLYSAFDKECKTKISSIFDSWIEGETQMFSLSR